MKTMNEIRARLADVERQADKTDYDDDRGVDKGSLEAGRFRGYLDALRWVLGKHGSNKRTPPAALIDPVVVGPVPVKYRIPADLGERLWLLQEGIPLTILRVAFYAWKKGTLPDKAFLVEMEEYLKTQGEKQIGLVSNDLGSAIYNGETGKDIEWTESPDEPEADDFSTGP
jgi:hypothetical protein